MACNALSAGLASQAAVPSSALMASTLAAKKRTTATRSGLSQAPSM